MLILMLCSRGHVECSLARVTFPMRSGAPPLLDARGNERMARTDATNTAHGTEHAQRTCREHSSRPHQCAAEKLCGNCASRCGLAADAKLLVALLTVSADWQHAGLHVRSIGEAVVHSASCGAYCAVHTCGCIVAGAADAAGFAGTANEAVSVAYGHAVAGRQTCTHLIAARASPGQLRCLRGTLKQRSVPLRSKLLAIGNDSPFSCR